MPELPELYMHRIGRTGRADATGTAISFIAPREEEKKIEVELLMNMELALEPFPEVVEISSKLIEPEKDRQPIKFLIKKQKCECPLMPWLSHICVSHLAESVASSMSPLARVTVSAYCRRRFSKCSSAA